MDLDGFVIGATDGPIGHVRDFHFDDEEWVIRYFVVETGSWLASRKVLISPFAIGNPDWTEKVLPASISKAQVENSPDIDTDKTDSRQQEIRYHGYYGYPFYWGGAGLWGDDDYPSMSMEAVPGYVAPPVVPAPDMPELQVQGEPFRVRQDDPHLRSCKAVIGYHVQAVDGDVGHVQALLVDVETWAVRYIVVDTSNWWLGHQVLIAPQWIGDVRWSDATVMVNLTQQAVKDAPAYDSAAMPDREQEAGIHDHYGRTGYWATEIVRESAVTSRVPEINPGPASTLLENAAR